MYFRSQQTALSPDKRRLNGSKIELSHPCTNARFDTRTAALIEAKFQCFDVDWNRPISLSPRAPYWSHLNPERASR
jgi:hypothetical protein